jgi:hypothetical protein
MHATPAMAVGLPDEDVYVREYPAIECSNSVVKKHPLLMSNPYTETSHGPFLGNNPIIHIRLSSAMRVGSHMSRSPRKLVVAIELAEEPSILFAPLDWLLQCSPQATLRHYAIGNAISSSPDTMSIQMRRTSILSEWPSLKSRPSAPRVSGRFAVRCHAKVMRADRPLWAEHVDLLN